MFLSFDDVFISSSLTPCLLLKTASHHSAVLKTTVLLWELYCYCTITLPEPLHSARAIYSENIICRPFTIDPTVTCIPPSTLFIAANSGGI